MLFGTQMRRTINVGEEVREGHIDDSLLIFHVTASGLPGRQINFTLTVSGETMSATVCGDQCGTVKLKKSTMCGGGRSARRSRCSTACRPSELAGGFQGRQVQHGDLR